MLDRAKWFCVVYQLDTKEERKSMSFYPMYAVDWAIWRCSETEPTAEKKKTISHTDMWDLFNICCSDWVVSIVWWYQPLPPAVLSQKPPQKNPLTHASNEWYSPDKFDKSLAYDPDLFARAVLCALFVLMLRCVSYVSVNGDDNDIELALPPMLKCECNSICTPCMCDCVRVNSIASNTWQNHATKSCFGLAFNETREVVTIHRLPPASSAQQKAKMTIEKTRPSHEKVFWLAQSTWSEWEMYCLNVSIWCLIYSIDDNYCLWNIQNAFRLES